MIGYIYSITINNNEYIGSTNNFSRRMKEHKRHSIRKNRKIYNLIRQNGGWKNCECNIIDINTYKTLNELREKEFMFIDLFKPNMNIII